MRSKTEKAIVCDQLKWLYTQRECITLIQNFRKPNEAYNKGAESFNSEVVNLNSDNYLTELENAIVNDKFSVLLKDDSLIGFHYKFAKKSGEIMKANLYYAPYPSEEESEELVKNKYFRIDFSSDTKDYTEYIHTKAHMHFGVYDTKIRLPVSQLIFPKDFLFFILKYVYNYNHSIMSIEKIHEDFKKESRREVVSVNEKLLFRMVLG